MTGKAGTVGVKLNFCKVKASGMLMGKNCLECGTCGCRVEDGNILSYNAHGNVFFTDTVCVRKCVDSIECLLFEDSGTLHYMHCACRFETCNFSPAINSCST